MSRFQLICAFFIAFFASQTIAANAVPHAQNVDFSKSVFTQDGAIICPFSIIEQHKTPISEIVNLFKSNNNRRARVKTAGCTEWIPGVELEDVDNTLPDLIVFTKNEVKFFTDRSQLTNAEAGQSRTASAGGTKLSEIMATIDSMPSKGDIDSSGRVPLFYRFPHNQMFKYKIQECEDQARAVGKGSFLISCLLGEVRAYEEMRKLPPAKTIYEVRASALCSEMATIDRIPNYAAWLKCTKAAPDMCGGDDYPSCVRAIRSGMWALRDKRRP